MTPAEKYTVGELDRELTALCEAHPERKNPVNGKTSCAYLVVSEAGDEERCLLGEWLHLRGHRYSTTWEDKRISTVLEYHIPDVHYPVAVIQRAKLWQELADAAWVLRRTWGELPALVRERDLRAGT